MTENLEELKPEGEVEPKTPATEEKVETPPTAEPTLEKLYTQKEQDAAVGKGVSSIQSQLTLSKAEAAEAKANLETLQADLQSLQGEHDDLVKQQFAEDPEAREAYKDKKAIAGAQRQLAKDTAEAQHKLYEAEKLVWAANMAKKANDLVQETGIDIKELEPCLTEEEMEVKALRYQASQVKEKPKPPSKPDSGINSGVGVDVDSLSAREKIDKGIEQAKKKTTGG